MHDSTDESQDVQWPQGEYAFDVDSFYEQAEGLSDKRHAQGKRYAVALIVTLTVLAKIGGADTFSAIAQWVRERGEGLCRQLHLRRAQLPSHSTYRRVWREAVDLAEVDALFQRQLRAGPTPAVPELIAIDGKVQRHSRAEDGRTPVQLVAAYRTAHRQVLAQERVRATHGDSEQAAARRVLKRLPLQGQIVMADALHTQQPFARAVLAARADYLLYAKGNQPRLLDDVRQSFAPERCGPGSSPQPTDWQQCRQLAVEHGRMERRVLTSSAALNGYLTWPRVGQVFRLERRVWTKAGQPLRTEVVYGLTSLRREVADARRLLDLTRAYWQIENGLHYRRDVTLGEDALRNSRPRLGEVQAMLNNFTIGLCYQWGYDNLPAARRHFAVHWHEALHYLLHAQNRK